MRALLRRMAEAGAGLAGPWAVRLSGRKVGVVLLYHRTGGPPGDPARELVPAIGAGAWVAQVDHLRRCYAVVPAASLVEAVAARRRGGRVPVAITFDDDLPEHGWAATQGVPVTVFLCGNALDAPHEHWWERLQRAHELGLESGPIGERSTALILGDPGERAAVAAELASRVGADRAGAGLRAGAVRALAERAEIGFHTRRHDFLPGLDDAGLAAALREGREELQALAGGAALDAIAYPHGGHDDRVVAAARGAGFVRGYTTEPAAVRPGVDPLRIPRWEPVAGWSRLGFAARLARVLLRG